MITLNKNFSTGIAKICICLLAMGIFTVAQAQEEKARKFCLSVGGGVLFINDNLFGGGGLTFGFMPSPKHLLSMEAGFGAGEPLLLDIYRYVYHDANGKILETKTDGIVNYRYNSFEFMLSWNRVYNLSKKWAIRVGPGMGLIRATGGVYCSPTTYKGVDIKGIPDRQEISKSAFMIGAIAGVNWNFTKRWFLDFNYRLSGNTPLDFPSRTVKVVNGNKKVQGENLGVIGNRINLAVGVRL